MRLARTSGDHCKGEKNGTDFVLCWCPLYESNAPVEVAAAPVLVQVPYKLARGGISIEALNG